MANYINNKKLYEEMTKYITELHYNRDNGLEPPRISNYIGESIVMIANKLAKKSNFSGYSYKEEMISDAIENCIMYIYNFNPEKTNNPFAYFTQIIKFAFIRRIQKEHKQHYIKIKNLHNYLLEDSYIDHDKIDNEITTEFVRNFERNTAKKKEIRKKGLEVFIDDDPVSIVKEDSDE